MGFFSFNKDKVEIDNLRNQLQNQINESSKLITQYQMLIQENSKLKDEYAEQVNINTELNDRYNKLVSAYHDLKERSEELQKKINFNDSNNWDYEDYLPIIYKKTRYRKTSLEIWKEKLERFINAKSRNQNYKAEVENAIFKLENCNKGIEGESYLLQKLLELKNNPFFKDMVILQDLCFKSPFENDNSCIQIDFLVITNYVIFIFDSKNRTGIEKIDENSKSFLNMQKYRKCVIELISENYLKSEFGMTEKNIYAVMVYSGKNQVNHSGITVKSTDNGSGYCEECDEIKYVFADNLVEDMYGVYSHAVRKHKSLGFCELTSMNVSHISNIILNYIKDNGHDFHKSYKCPICGEGIMVKKHSSKTDEDFLGCTKYPNCKYTESIN